MNGPPDAIKAKITLRNAGWTWNRKLRRWEYATEAGVVQAASLREALRIHQQVRDTVQEQKVLQVMKYGSGQVQ